MKTLQLRELAKLATPWPWKWFTSNSHNRLSSVPSGKDGDVISAFKAADGAACVSISQDDMAFIEAAHPGAVLELIERLEAAEKLAEFRLKIINSMDALVAGRNNRIAELESWVRGVEEAMISATDHAAAADRELYEAIMTRLEVSEGLSIATRRYELAEEEIARRDAAAGEPVGLLEFSDYMTAEELAGMKPRRVAVKELFEGGLKVGDHLYTAAPPAVLPPEMKPEPEKYDVIDHGFITGYNQCRAEALALGAPPQKPAVVSDDALREVIRIWQRSGCPSPEVYSQMREALGAQPQKPVSMPESVRIDNGYYFDMDDIFVALDAANVPYEVKK